MTTSTAPGTVLVTGSTSGIGAATATSLAAAGWLVVVTGRDEARGSSVVDEITSAGGRAVFVRSDLTASPDGLRAFAAAATDAAGGTLDAVVHNAALCPPVDTPSLTDADLEATLATNIPGPRNRGLEESASTRFHPAPREPRSMRVTTTSSRR